MSSESLKKNINPLNDDWDARENEKAKRRNRRKDSNSKVRRFYSLFGHTLIQFTAK